MDELSKQSIVDEKPSAQPGGGNEQQTQNVAGESTVLPEMQVGKLICPRCGNAFDQKEKKCPHCGMKNSLKLCKTCGATIAKNAKRCPKCGAKNKKPIYKRVWFWILVAVAALMIISDLLPDTSSTSLPENAIVGIWKATRYFDLEERNSASIEELGIEWELKFNTDHTGTMTTETGGVTALKWNYSLETAEGDKLYNVNDDIDELTLAIIGKYGDLSEYEGDLLLSKDNSAVIFERAG